MQSRGVREFLLRPLEIMSAYRKDYVSNDLIAGMTVAAVAIPQAIAYASIAELPPQYGLYTAIVAAIVGSLWGCSRFLATGPVNATSLLVLPILLAVAIPGTPEFLLAASTIAVMAGILRIILALIHFGAAVTLASKPVLIGFTAGAAVHIAVGQLRHLLGLDVPAVPELYRSVGALAAAVSGTNLFCLSLGLGALLMMIAFKRVSSKFPAALTAIAIAALVTFAFDLPGSGVRVVGTIPRSLPPPTWITTGMFPDLQMIRALLLGSMAVAALGLIEATAASRTLARQSGDRLNSNQEFFGQGMANIASGLLSGYPCSGSFTRSALAHQSGARTHMTGVFTGLTILVGMLVLAPLASFIPRAAIAGVLLVIAYRMVDKEGIKQAIRTSRAEAAIMAITFCSTMILPLDFAVLSGVIFSLAFFVIRSSLPRLVPVVPDPTYRHLINNPEAPVCPQLGILNIRGPLFFGAVYHLEEELRHNHERHPGQNLLVLRMHGVDICDLSGIEMLETTVKTYRDIGGDVFLVRPRGPVLEKMESSGFLDTLGRDHLLKQEDAIEYLFDQVLDPTVCIYECEHRVFAECQALEKHAYGVEFPSAPKHPLDPGRHVSATVFQELASNENALVIDVREPLEYTRAHIPGATLLPLRMLPEKGPDLPRDRPLLFVCRSGRRTSRAIHMLLDMGFDDIHGLRGGILAWHAGGLPVSTASEEEGDAFDPETAFAESEESHRERRVLALMRLKAATEELDEKLKFMSTTYSLSYLKDAVERSLDRFSSTAEENAADIVNLDPTRPVLIVSDLHAQRRTLRKLLLDRYVGTTSNLQSIVQGNLQLLLLGDILHSEDRSRWQAVEDEFITEFATSDEDVGETPAMDREMANSFGLAAMIMTLQQSVPGVHCLKGNHDNLLNSDEGGNGAITKLVSWPGEGEIARAWTLIRFGSKFAGRYAAWENRLPIFATYHNRDNGLKFVASHSEPGAAYTPEQIEKRSDDIVFGLTWSRNKGTFAPDVLRNFFGRDWINANYFVSHTGSEEGIVHMPRNRLVIVNKPLHLVAALVRPGVKEFEIHIVAAG